MFFPANRVHMTNKFLPLHNLLQRKRRQSDSSSLMSVRLRFALHGTRHNRIFHLVAIDKAKRRDGKPTETLGIYNPHMTRDQTHKTVEWSVDRIRYWLHVGAVPSKSVSKLLEIVR